MSESTTAAPRLLRDHNSQATAYVAHGYPFGYTLKTPKRYWIETKKGHGQRLATDTAHKSYLPGYTDAVDRDAHYRQSPPRVWNKPKCGNYYTLVVLYLDADGHVQSDGLSIYGSVESVVKFGERWQSQFDAEQAERYALVVKMSRKMNPQSWAKIDNESESK